MTNSNPVNSSFAARNFKPHSRASPKDLTRLQVLGRRLVIALDTFVHHVGHASFVAGDKTADLVARSDAALIAKLKKVYGERLPTSHQLWGCDVFDEAFLRK